MLGAVVVTGTVGYVLLGFSLLDALYQTITTITTVGFREVEEFGTAEKWFTIVVIVLGVGTVLYTFTTVVQFVVEGQFRELVGRKRMNRRIAEMSGHVVVCGWGRVGRAVTADLRQAGRDVVAVDLDADRLSGLDVPVVIGDATLDATLRAAGVASAQSLVVVAGDRRRQPVRDAGRAGDEPGPVHRRQARVDDSMAKLSQAGADRVVNPQELGAAGIASFVVQPNVAEFIDVVMHERSMEFRMQEVELPASSPLAGRSLRDANLRSHTNVLVLAVREADGRFVTNPAPDLRLNAGSVIIAVGTSTDLHRFVDYCRATP